MGSDLDVVFLLGIQIRDTEAQTVSLVGIGAFQTILFDADFLVGQLTARGMTDTVVVDFAVGRTGWQEADLDSVRERSFLLQIRRGWWGCRLCGECDPFGEGTLADRVLCTDADSVLCVWDQIVKSETLLFVTCSRVLSPGIQTLELVLVVSDLAILKN